MNFVQPIRDKEKINQIKEELKVTNVRNYMLFVLGINTGLRISDILKLKVGDLKDSHLSMREQKTGKQKQIYITPELKRELKWYLDGRDDNEYLIKSRQGNNRPIGRHMAYRILREIAKKYKLKDIGTHTLRKTFGYHMYLKNRNIALLMTIFNHSSERITLRYIGLDQDAMDRAFMNFKI
jgi:integrase